MHGHVAVREQNRASSCSGAWTDLQFLIGRLNVDYTACSSFPSAEAYIDIVTWISIDDHSRIEDVTVLATLAMTHYGVYGPQRGTFPPNLHIASCSSDSV